MLNNAKEITRIHDARYGKDGKEVFEKNGILYNARGEAYPDDPGEIIRRGLFVPDGKMEGIRARWSVRKAAEQRVVYNDNLPRKSIEGPTRTTTLKELLLNSEESEAKTTLAKVSRLKARKK